MGMNMGLPAWTKGSSAIVVSSDDIIPLSIDEFDRVNGWMKKFNPRAGSGFICNRTWAWNVGANEMDLEIVYHLATYGLK